MAEEFTHEQIVAFKEAVAKFWNRQRQYHDKIEMSVDEIYDICSAGINLQVDQYQERPEEMPRALELLVAHLAITSP